jgi:hypothetical protein
MQLDIEYNFRLCQERHKKLDSSFSQVNARIEKIENRFLVLITLLIANLILPIVLKVL